MNIDDDVPMRRGRDGDLYPARMEEAPTPPPHLCHRGWLAPATDGTPVPCLVCKPHLIRRHLPARNDPAATTRGRALVRRVLVDAGIATHRRTA